MTDKMIDRQDFVDNSIFELINSLIPGNDKIDWNIELIAKVRDSIEEVIVDDLKLCDREVFYP